MRECGTAELRGVRQGRGALSLMFVEQIEIQKYRHLENISIGRFHRPGDASDLVVLAGPNGGGKSSILELISLALSNMYSLTYALNRTQSESAFEVTIGLLPSEVELITKHQTAPSASHQRALEYLTAHHSYRRSFNFPGGEYQKDPTLHNQVHELVVTVLRTSFTRPLGFFLGADRSYQKAQFKRDNLFNYTQYSRYDYVWGYAFQASAAQYKDMFDFLVTWRYHFTRQVGSYHLQRAAGLLDDSATPEPVDVYAAILRRVFPGYDFVDKPEDAPTDLFVRIPSGEVISFSDLSSGEKEVFFTLCFFQRHNVEEAVIIVDEPELHLHPSLARLLLRTMLELKPRNQIWIATQSSEVIDEAGRDKVAFVRRRPDTGKAEVVWSPDEEESLRCLRDFFGQSGYVGLAKAMIFTEGQNASVDRKMFAKLFPEASRDIKFIPATGCSEIERINRAVLSILESNLGWCRFLLVRDRDYMTDDMVAILRSRAGQSVVVLNRHELENYLIDFELISRTLGELFDIGKNPAQVEADLQGVARAMAGDVLRDMVCFRLNLLFRPQDFSVPALFSGEIAFTAGQAWTGKKDDLRLALEQRADGVLEALRQQVEGHHFGTLFDQCRTEVEHALSSSAWSNVFPGKQLLDQYCKLLSVKPPVLHNAIIKEMSAQRGRIPSEINELIAKALAN
jgi:energy-coupling factor transporter ATP-binding protein EcfA2